jgi:hypothetical protein
MSIESYPDIFRLFQKFGQFEPPFYTLFFK